MESNDSPEIPNRGETSDIPSLSLGHIKKTMKPLTHLVDFNITNKLINKNNNHVLLKAHPFIPEHLNDIKAPTYTFEKIPKMCPCISEGKMHQQISENPYIKMHPHILQDIPQLPVH